MSDSVNNFHEESIDSFDKFSDPYFKLFDLNFKFLLNSSFSFIFLYKIYLIQMKY